MYIDALALVFAKAVNTQTGTPELWLHAVMHFLNHHFEKG